MKTTSESIAQASSYLEHAKSQDCSLEELSDLSIKLASLMWKEANQIQTRSEKNQQKQIAGMIAEPQAKIFTSYMTDQCFRTKETSRVADQFIYLLKRFGIPDYLSFFKQLQLKLFLGIGRSLSAISIPAMTWALRKQTESVILPGETKKIQHHLRQRQTQGIRINLNHLGEAILGEEEAARRLQIYFDDLSNPQIEYISIKISTIYSQINLLAWEKNLDLLSDRLRQLYRAAMRHPYIRSDGSKGEKFVNLDMEEYRDLHLTVELFKKVLNEEEFTHFSAGIVLQAYLPDSYEIQKELTEWAIQRCEKGGAPIKIRIVKGANLAMERLEAALKGWPQAPFYQKVDVDANYQKMRLFGMQPRHARAVHLGIGSHNLFDIAFSMLLRAHHHVEPYVCFEMLEGMASHLSRVVQQLSGGILLYCPAAKRHEFQNAIAYLIRRLDENTAENNFLRHAFQLEEGSPVWEHQVDSFKKAFAHLSSVRQTANREQNRNCEPLFPPVDSPFTNEPDTDFSLLPNRKWAEQIVQTWKEKQNLCIPIVIPESILVPEGIGTDPSCPGKQLYKYTMATEEHVELALATADAAAKQPLDITSLSHLMAHVAQGMRRRRGDLIGAMMADAGKTFTEADVEVSEAIDMAEYYRRCREELESHSDLKWTPKGVVVVVPPWNFPCAIPAGGIIAALMGGNSVIFKPSRETVLVAWTLANIFWEAGVSKETLQFITGSSSIIGNKLISDPRVKAVVLTGSTATGKQMLSVRPDLHLMAETGGKNAIIVTKLADRDLAIKEIVHSAFGHTGQKCSATSLLILEEEIYDDLHFREQLRDAAASLIVGPSWDLATKVNPLTHPPGKELKRGLSTLDSDESWLLQPLQDPHNPNLWSPGIKWGVQEGSFSHHTELFGPVLSVMCANNLEEAIRLANGTPYGLTSGLHSLDEREHAIWLNHIEVGNCYINRGTTGAIVRRQPFGGCKESCIGPGAKAGGPNYLVHFMNVEQIAQPIEKHLCPENAEYQKLSGLDNHLKLQQPDSCTWEAAVESYSLWWEKYRQDSDPSQIPGQDNILRYIPHKRIVLRLQQQDTPLRLKMVCAAALTCQTPLQISFSSHEIGWLKAAEWPSLQGIELVEEGEEDLVERMSSHTIKRMRTLSPASQPLIQAAAASLCYICQTPPLINGRIELLNYLREMAISIDYHRYGNLGERETSNK